MVSINLSTKICSAQKIKVQTKLVYDYKLNTPMVGRKMAPTKYFHIPIPESVKMSSRMGKGILQMSLTALK